jgi:hypothetical protein
MYITKYICTYICTARLYRVSSSAMPASQRLGCWVRSFVDFQIADIRISNPKLTQPFKLSKYR